MFCSTIFRNSASSIFDPFFIKSRASSSPWILKSTSDGLTKHSSTRSCAMSFLTYLSVWFLCLLTLSHWFLRKSWSNFLSSSNTVVRVCIDLDYILRRRHARFVVNLKIESFVSSLSHSHDPLRLPQCSPDIMQIWVWTKRKPPFALLDPKVLLKCCMFQIDTWCNYSKEQWHTGTNTTTFLDEKVFCKDLRSFDANAHTSG